MHSPDVKVSVSKLVAAIDGAPNAQGQLRFDLMGNITCNGVIVATATTHQDAAGLAAAYNAMPLMIELVTALLAQRLARGKSSNAIEDSGRALTIEELTRLMAELNAANERLKSGLARLQR